MIEKIRALCIKYEEIIAYLIVGVINTIVSLGAWKLFEVTIFDVDVIWQNVVLNLIVWVVGVSVGYVMNRKYVFKSKEPNILKECLQFSGGRVSTGVLDILLNVIMVNMLGLNEDFTKIVASVLVVIGNYIVSKWFVFKKKDVVEATEKSNHSY